MNQCKIFNPSEVTTLTLASAAMLSMLSDAAHAQTAKDLVGTWQVVSVVSISADGKKTDAFGAHVTGMAIFDDNGHFVYMNGNPDIPKFASNNRAQGTAEENKASVQGTNAFFGNYSVADKIITMKIAYSTYPNWTGTDQKRTVLSFTGDELKYNVTASTVGQNEVTLKRIK